MLLVCTRVYSYFTRMLLVCYSCVVLVTIVQCVRVLTSYLLRRGYNRNFVTKQIQRAPDIPRILTLQNKTVNKLTSIPFIITFSPSLPHISNIIKRHYNLLLTSNRCVSTSTCCCFQTLSLHSRLISFSQNTL